MLLDAKNQRIETVNRFKNLLPLDNRTKYHPLPLYSNSRPKVERKYYPLSTSRFHEMIWHASRRHIHICVWRGSLLIVYLSFFIATIIRLEMVGEMRLISSIGARILRKREKKEREIVGEKKIMERGRVVVGTRRGNSRRERSSLLRGFGRAKSRVPKSTSLPSNPPRAGQSLQLDPPFPLIPLLNFH